MTKPTLLLTTFAALASTLAQASETAKVLPKGVFRFRMVGVTTDPVTNKYNDAGELQGMTYSLNRSVTVSDLAAKEPRLVSLVSSLNGLQPGLGNDLMAANLYSDFSLSATQVMPALEYGVSDRFSIGIRAPIVTRKVKASFSASSINNASAIQEQIGNLSPDLTNGIYSFSTKSFDTAFFESALFTSKGYQPPRDLESTQWGDTRMGLKYNLYAKDGFWFTALAGTRIPTGSNPSLTNRLDGGTGQGNWGIGAQLFQDWEMNPVVTLSSAQKVTHSLPDTRQRAVPRDSADTLPSVRPEDGQVQDVTRKQGLEFEGELASTLTPFGKSWSLWGAYQLLTRGKDTFSGPGNLFYAGLSEGTSVLSHAAELGVGFSTIPAFRDKRFAVPLEVKALYNTVVAGRNTPYASYGRLDLIVYF